MSTLLSAKKISAIGYHREKGLDMSRFPTGTDAILGQSFRGDVNRPAYSYTLFSCLHF
jgi:hypothetical protein